MSDEFAELLKWYLMVVEGADNEITRADRFRDFIRKAFPNIDVGHLGGFYPELEKYVKYSGSGSLIRGKPDSLFGSLVIEFESVLDDRRLEEAEAQLRRYVAALWSMQAARGQKRGRFTAVASDGVRFVVYRPRTVISAGTVAVEHVLLEPVDQVDIEELPASDVYNWLDYQGKLTMQNLRRKFKVLYNTSGTYLVSCVVENKPIRIAGTKIHVKGVIADWTTYWIEMKEEDEAYYISAILNSSIVDKAIKPMQAKGSFGERHIVKKPLELPIPRFNPNNPIHTRLAQISKECHEKVQQILPALTSKYKSIGKIRSEIKKHLRKELREIDELAKQILKAA